MLEAKQDMLNEKSLTNAFTFIEQLKEDSLVKQVDSISTALNVKSSDQLQAMLENPQISAQTKPAVDSFINGHYMLIKAMLDTDQNSDQAKDFVRKWKDKHSPFTVHIGGYQNLNKKYSMKFMKKLHMVWLLFYFQRMSF